ncbi:Sialate O-acetylesterase, partial [Charadrius vociferus]
PSGTWTTVLDPMDRGGPYTLTAGQGSENVTLRDIYFGDVWLCSGQSNMVMTVSQIANASQELADAARYPYVRVFAAAPARSDVELEDLERINLPWSIPTAENLGHGNFTYFSAVCWLLGRYLYEALRYPVGLVEAAWGGTPVETWSSPRALRACGLPEDTESKDPLFAGVPPLVFCSPLSPDLSSSISPHRQLSGPQTPSVLWNAMIHPLLNMTLRGIAWYQALRACGLPEDTERSCRVPNPGQGPQRPFLGPMAEPLHPCVCVCPLPNSTSQLSTYRRQSPDDSFARLRWHQTADLGVVPNARMPGTFMAVAMDLGDERSPYGRTHPR